MYSCPKCRGEIRYRTNLWTPWRANPLFRCRQCATMLQRVHTIRSQLLKIGVCAAFVAAEVATVWLNRATIFNGATPSALVPVVAALVMILVVSMLMMRLVTQYTLVARRDESPLSE